MNTQSKTRQQPEAFIYSHYDDLNLFVSNLELIAQRSSSLASILPNGDFLLFGCLFNPKTEESLTQIDSLFVRGLKLLGQSGNKIQLSTTGSLLCLEFNGDFASVPYQSGNVLELLIKALRINCMIHQQPTN